MPSNHDLNRATTSKLLKLILALHRKELVDIPDAGHTDDILLLLRVANGDSELMAWATSVTGADAEEMRAACVSFVERVCFSGETDPFGVLGLNPWANADAVKEHYRLLIRIFHPDRGQVGNKVAEAYSARINQAYASLKQQLGGDGGKLPERAAANYRGQSGIIPRRFTRPVSVQNNGGDSLRWASSLTPARVLFGMALIAGLIIYLSFPQKMRSQPKAHDVVEKPVQTVSEVGFTPVTELAEASLPPLPDEVIADSPVAVVATLQDSQAAIPEPLPIVANSVKAENAPLLKKPLEKLAPAAVVNNKNTVAKNMVAVATKADAKPLDVKPVEIKPIETKPVNKTGAVRSAVMTAAATAVQSPAESQVNKKLNVPVAEGAITVEAREIPVQPRTVAAKTVDMPSDRELHDLIASFMSNYANGDVNAFIQSFDEQVRSDEDGGKSGLYNAYADLFAKTASRSIVLKDLQWKKQGSVAIAHADYRASTLRTGETQVKTSSGTLQIEVIKAGGRVMISGFFYQVANK